MPRMSDRPLCGSWVKKDGTVKWIHTRAGDGVLREHLAAGWVKCDQDGNEVVSLNDGHRLVAPHPSTLDVDDGFNVEAGSYTREYRPATHAPVQGDSAGIPTPAKSKPAGVTRHRR